MLSLKEEKTRKEVSSDKDGTENKENSVHVQQKTLTYADEEGEKISKEEDVKVIWKKAETATNPSKGRKGAAAKAFFNPNPENKDGEAEQVRHWIVTQKN